MNPCIMVVKGVTTVDPSGAFSVPSKGFPVDKSVPPETTIVPFAFTSSKFPYSSVIVVASSAF